MEESLDLYKSILDQFQIKKQNVCTYSPLTLAYIGDAIYEIIIRTIVVGEGNRQVNQLHKKSSNLAKAATQAEMVLKLQPFLEEEEEQETSYLAAAERILSFSFISILSPSLYLF